MLSACLSELPLDAAICAAAVTDWKPAETATQKLKKTPGAPAPDIKLMQTPDILAALSAPGPNRPKLVVGFALETENLIENATAKLKSKGCDWIVANTATQELVAQESTVFGSDNNTIALVTPAGPEFWPRLSKQEVGKRLAASVADYLELIPFPREPARISE
jgi:phosphopantothenoylcysteine decarboxylase/phosphopantothenate--cysteine ligase